MLQFSLLVFFLSGSVCLAVYTAILAINRRFRNSLSFLPGPEISKWTGLVEKYHFLRGNKPRYVQSLHERYGSVVRVSPDEVAIADVAAARQIHKVGNKYLKAGFYEHIGHRSAKTLFSSQNPKHHTIRRRMLSAPMSESSINQFEHIILARVRLCIDRMAEELKTRGAIDVFKWWLFFATDTIGELAFGDSFRMLEIGKKNQYTTDLESLYAFMTIRTTFPFLVKLSQYIPIPLFTNAGASGARMGTYAAESILRYRLLVSANPSSPNPTLFANVFTAGEKGLTDPEIRLEAGGYIAAGSDTSAVTLTYLVWAVCQDEDVRGRLVAEVASLLGDLDDGRVRELPYLNQVVAETLRLYPAVPGALPRAVPSEGAMLAGWEFPGGATVSTQAFSLHRDPDVFLEPERFDPSRWAAPTQAMKAAFMPFGGGSRICIGMHLAHMEMRLAAAAFFRAFSNAQASAKEGFNSQAEMQQEMYFLVSPRGHRCLVDTGS